MGDLVVHVDLVEPADDQVDEVRRYHDVGVSPEVQLETKKGERDGGENKSEINRAGMQEYSNIML